LAMKPTPNYQLLSTTTTLGKVRGFTIELLFHLSEGSRRCRDLVEITGKPHSYVWRYLKNMQKYGLVEKNGAFWELSILGREFLSHINILYINISEYRKKIERKQKDNRKKVENCTPKKPKQVRISAWLSSSDLNELESKVVEVLVDHYNKTGSKFLYFRDHYEAAEFFECTPDEITKAMRKLKQDKIAYPWRDRSLNAWKIGLYKDFLERLKVIKP